MKKRQGRAIAYLCDGCNRGLAKNTDPKLALQFAVELAEEEGWKFKEGGKYILCPTCSQIKDREAKLLETIKAIRAQGDKMSVSILCQKLGLSRSVMMSYLNRLKEKGIVEWKAGDLGTLEVIQDE